METPSVSAVMKATLSGIMAATLCFGAQTKARGTRQ